MKQTNPKRAWITASAPNDSIQSQAEACREYHASGFIRLTGNASDLQIEAEAPAGSTAKKARKFSMTAYTGGAMRVAAFYDPVVVDLSGLDVGNSARPILINHTHDLEHLLGQTESIEVRAGKLLVAGNAFPESETAKRVVALNDKGFQFQASIGASVIDREHIPAGKSTTANGRTFQGPINIARKSVLGEVSFVVLGADDKTSANIAAATHAAERKAMQSFQEWLAAMGLSIDGLSDEQKSKLEAKYTAEQEALKATATPPKGKKGKTQPAPVVATATVEDEPQDDAEVALAEVRAKRAADIKRIGEIEAMADTYKDRVEKIADVQAEAITKGWSVDQFELKCLRDARPTAPVAAPNIITGGSNDVSGSMLEAACCLTGKLSDVEKRFDVKTLEAADKKWRGSLSLQEMLLEAAWANGYTGRNFKSDPRAAMRFAFRTNVEAGFSTIDISGILSNTANKFLLEGFNHVESAWRNISAIRSVTDFKTITSYRMTGAQQYVKIAPGGEIPHGTLGEESFTNAAETYGLMLSVNRTDIINDDLGAITGVPRRLGRGAGLKLNDVFWTEFLDNAAFFSAGNSNLVTTATYVLGAVGLKKVVETFRKQTDPDGKPLGISPKYLLIPPELEVTAEELFVSTHNNTGGSATTEKVPNRNVFANKYQPIVSTYLSNSSYSGYSTTGYYLLADPMDLAVIETCFLNGQQSPTIETADANFNTLGIQMRGYHDFGVNKQEHRAGVRANGA